MLRSRTSILMVTVMVIAWGALLILPLNAVAKEKVLKVRVSMGAKIFDPARATLHEASIFTRAVYDNLVDYPPGRWPNLQTELAEKYEVSSDGKIYIFYLKKGVLWQKGFGELTSEDVKFTIERIINPETKSPLRVYWASVIEKVEAPNEYTVKVFLKKQDPAFLYKMAPWRAGSILSKKAVEKFGQDYGRKSDAIVGCGPFEVAAWTPGQKIVLKRFDKYHGSKAKVDRIEIPIIKDESTALLSLQKGELDICYLRVSENVAMARKDPNLNLYKASSGATGGFVGFNLEHPILKDMRVRQAMVYALDRDLIVKQVGGENAEKACGWLAPGSYLGALTCDELPNYPYDPKKAKDLLAEAGYSKGFKIKYYEVNLKSHRDLAPVLQSYWGQVGIETEIELLPIRELVSRMYKANMTIFKYPFGNRPPEPSLFLYGSFHSSSSRPGLNTMLYKGADDLLDKAVSTTNETERQALYAQVQKKIIEDCAIIPIYYTSLSVATRKNVDLGQGVEGDRLTSPYWYYYWFEEMDLR